MTIETKIFIQEDLKNSSEWAEVKSISDKFLKYLSEPKTQKKLLISNIPGAKSQRIEEIITPFAESIGFSSQKDKLFEKYKVKNLFLIII